jgi:Zn-dependent protease with chaperone function
MSTRFFEHQEEARRNTTWLVVLFACAVVGILALLYALAVALTGLPQTDAAGRVVGARFDWWQPELLVQVGLATLAVVAGGSLYKIAQLRGGGAVVAESLGGRLVPSDTRDPDARRLLNVVEEMAIASGTPTPPVYLLDEEDGINAFAAGFTPSDAVIGVTRGCVRRLSRDELQGVVAHEFSHILSGDMRLNIRLMGVVHGILLIGIIGYFLLRSSMFAGGRRSGRDNSGAAMVIAGLGLMIVGFVGTFFGNLIKASVSRQREFLADASAVQFTRNPAGIAGALGKIAGLEQGSVLVSPAAPEASHLLFGQGLRGGLQMIFATHPPIEERIRRLDPGFAGAAGAREAGAAPSLGDAAAGLAGGTAGPRGARSVPDAPLGAAIDQIGEPTAAHIEYATALIAGLPPAVTEACHEPHGARAVVQALLLDHDDAVRRRQLEGLARDDDPGLATETRRLFGDVATLDPAARLPLIDLTLPALRRLSPEQYARFRDDVQALVEADRRIDLFEWTLHRILLAHLRPDFERVRPPRRHLTLARVVDACSVVLSALARLGTSGDPAVRDAFDRGAAVLGVAGARLLAPDDCDLAAVDGALDRLERARAPAAERLLRACAACVAADGLVSQSQGELVRAIADSLGCPMPPLLPGQRLA